MSPVQAHNAQLATGYYLHRYRYSLGCGLLSLAGLREHRSLQVTLCVSGPKNPTMSRLFGQSRLAGLLACWLAGLLATRYTVTT